MCINVMMYTLCNVYKCDVVHYVMYINVMLYTLCNVYKCDVVHSM